MVSGSFRRIVTGHDGQGRSVIVSDTANLRSIKVGGEVGGVFHEVWSTRETPAPIVRTPEEPAERDVILPPPPGGTRIRVVDIPPESETLQLLTSEMLHALFASLGVGGALRFGAEHSARHPFMHRTRSLDYGIVLSGEVTLLVDEGETVVREGDIIVQAGTSHAWANRSGRDCRIAFILIDGIFEDGLPEPEDHARRQTPSHPDLPSVTLSPLTSPGVNCGAD